MGEKVFVRGVVAEELRKRGYCMEEVIVVRGGKVVPDTEWVEGEVEVIKVVSVG